MNNPPSQRARELSEKIAENSFYYVITRPDNYRERITLIIAPLIQQAFDEEFAEANARVELAEKRRGGECCKCGSWVCPPLTCFSCLSSAPDELRKMNQEMTSQLEAKDAKIAELEELGKTLDIALESL